MELGEFPAIPPDTASLASTFGIAPHRWCSSHREEAMDFTLELVVVPVSDVERAKAFYGERCGFHVDVDRSFGDTFRVVQLTPPGSACSISIGTGLATMTPGSLQGLQLCVTDIDAARAQLVRQGVDATPVRFLEDGEWKDGHGGPWNSFFFFSDPDGNGWTVQEKPAASA
jgi:catechol 2,3-dioxygenase-like lactoylglutathione lyase family enzyme